VEEKEEIMFTLELIGAIILGMAIASWLDRNTNCDDFIEW
jgi:hypothetical protein